MTHYATGRAFEYRVKRDLRKRGYYVSRSAGSHGAIDVLGHADGVILMVQCKTDGELPADEWNMLCLLAHWARPIAVPLLASKDERGHIVYARLTGEKVGRSRPCEKWEPKEVGES